MVIMVWTLLLDKYGSRRNGRLTGSKHMLISTMLCYCCVWSSALPGCIICKIALLVSWKLGHVEIIDVMVFPVTSRYTVCNSAWTLDVHCLIKQVPSWLHSWGEPGITENITYQCYKPSVVWSPEPLSSLPLWKLIAYGSLRTLILVDLGNIFMSAYLFKILHFSLDINSKHCF